MHIDLFNSYFGQPSPHPLIGVGDLARADASIFTPTDFGMYCVVLMDVNFGQLTKDGNEITYRPGTLFSLRPGQEVALTRDHGVEPRGMILAFRPELLQKTGLGRDFYMFRFFFYDVLEAIELTRIERNIVMNCFSNLIAELNTPLHVRPAPATWNRTASKLCKTLLRTAVLRYSQIVLIGCRPPRPYCRQLSFKRTSGAKRTTDRSMVRRRIQPVTKLFRRPRETRTAHNRSGIHTPENHYGSLPVTQNNNAFCK